MLLPPYSVGKVVVFSGCPSAAFFCSFVSTDLVITIRHEQLEKSGWNLQRIFTSSYWWPDWVLEVNLRCWCPTL